MTRDRKTEEPWLSGVTTALVTPFTKKGDVDVAALGQHVVFQVSKGVKTLVICGTIGEWPSLSCEERREIAECAVSTSAGNARIVVGVASDQLSVTRNLLAHAAECGADAALVSVPPHFRLSENEQLEFYNWFDRESRLPWILYGAADVRSEAPSPEFLRRLSGLDKLIAYKEPRSDLARVQGIVQELGTDLPVIAAAEVALPQALLAGAVGTMTATSCFLPELLQALVRGVAEDDLATVRRAHNAILEFRRPFQSRMQIGFPSYLPYTKAACEIIGLPTGPVRAPLRALESHEQRSLAQLIEVSLLPAARGLEAAYASSKRELEGPDRSVLAAAEFERSDR